MNLLFTSRLAVALIFFAISHGVGAQGGPPLLTDDPDTIGGGNWEINTAYTVERTRNGRTARVPLIDINYGFGDHVQLKYEVAWLSVDQSDPSGIRSGLGNSLAGVRWRFLDEDKVGFGMSV